MPGTLFACLYNLRKKWPHNVSTGALTTYISTPSKLVSVDQMVSGIGDHIPFQADQASHGQYKYLYPLDQSP